MEQVKTLSDPFTFARRVRRLLGRACRAIILRREPARRFSDPLPPVVGYAQHLKGEWEPAPRALLCYVSAPFHGRDRANANYNIADKAIAIADAFNHLGYVVDAIDWLDGSFQPTREYAVFFATYRNFARLVRSLPANAVKIYYATRAHHAFHRRAQELRLAELQRRRGTLPATRELDDPLEGQDLEAADVVVVLGNDFTAATYRPHHPNVVSIDTIALSLEPIDLATKDFGTACKRFVYLASWPFVKKGMDLVLEAFARTPELELFVCAPIQSEPDLAAFYRTELFHTPNIHTVGWVDMISDEWRQLAHRSAFLIFPTAAEGSAGAVVNSMAMGLIPIVTREAGVDCEGVGHLLRDVRIETIIEAIRSAADWSPDRCRTTAEAARHEAKTRYTLERYQRRIEQIVGEAIERKRGPGISR